MNRNEIEMIMSVRFRLAFESELFDGFLGLLLLALWAWLTNVFDVIFDVVFELLFRFVISGELSEC